MDKAIKWLEVPIKVLLWLGMLAGFLMMMHVTFDVTGRTVFGRPLAGTTEIVAAYYMVAVAYLPWAWITRNDGHIMVELFTRSVSRRFIVWTDIVVKILTISYVSLFTWQTFFRAIEQMQAGEVWEAGSAYVAVWPSRWMLPVAGFTMVLYLVLRVVSDVARATRRGAEESGK